VAGKYALYLPYKVLDSLSSGNVTDSEFREFIMGLAEYDKSGVFPASHTAGFAMMFELLKSDLDFAKAKYEEIIEKRRIAGQQGGTPIGNKNAVKNRGGGAPEGNQNAVGNRGGRAPAGNQNARKEVPDDQETEPDDVKQTQTQAKQAKQADNSSQYSVNSIQLKDKRNSSSSSADPAGDGVVVSAKQPQTTTTDFINIQNFLEASKNAGFTLDRKAAERILENEGFRHWINGRFNFLKNFLKYTAQRIKSDPKYADKPGQEQKRLFISALSWEDFQDDYLEWREKTDRKAAEIAERRRIEQVKADKPKTCGHCGAALALEGLRGSCPSCNYDFLFNDEKGEWEAHEPFNFSEAFKEHLRQSHISVNAANDDTSQHFTEAEVIDF
jgi:hypothetical protein